MITTSIPQQNEGRDPAVFLHIGAKKTGKTQGTLDMIAEMVITQDVPVLILDTGSQPQYDVFPELELDELYLWPRIAVESEERIFRVRTLHYDRFFQEVAAHVRNSGVFFEDATPYFEHPLKHSVKHLILQSRNMGNDYVVNLHSLTDVAPFAFRYTEYIILRQTKDDMDKLKRTVPIQHILQEAMAEIKLENESLVHKIAYRLIKTQEL